MNEEERKRVIKIAQDFFDKHQLTMECNIEAKEFQAFYHILLDYQKLQKENENQKENYKNLILNVSKIAIELGLEEDGTIDEIYAKIREKDKQIKDLQLRKDSQEKRFKKYKENIEKKHEEIYENLVAENETKDKQIDLMAKAIDNYDTQLVINKFKDKEDIKQYFETKAKEKGE